MTYHQFRLSINPFIDRNSALTGSLQFFRQMFKQQMSLANDWKIEVVPRFLEIVDVTLVTRIEVIRKARSNNAIQASERG